MAKMTAAQKTMMREFNQKFFDLQEKYWNPVDSDIYWDHLTDDAMKLLSEFQSNDSNLNNFLSAVIAAFLNSREELFA